MSLTYTTPVEGQAWTGPGVDGLTAAIRAVNGLAELVAATDPAWLIDARLSETDRVGAVDPTPMTNTLLPADGVVRAVSLNTNETGDGVTSTGSYLWTDDPAIAVTGDIDIRVACESIDDVTNNGLVPQAVKVAKYLGDTLNTFDYMVSVLNDGDANLSFGANAAVVAASLDQTDGTALRWTRVAATGVVSAYIEDAAGAVTTADGRKWTLLGTDTEATGDLPDTANSILTFMIGKGHGGWCQVYDGIDGTLVVDLDVDRDATAGLSVGDTFTDGTGNVWTLNEACATFGCDRRAWIVGSPGETADGPFTVADAAALDIVGDFTVAMVYEPSTVSTGGFRAILSKVDPATLGTTAVGWAFVDYSPLGGVGFALNDGTGLVTAFGAWTAGERHLLVATGDRDGNLRLFIDDMATPVATTDISARAGTLANALDVTSSNPDPALLGAVAKWDRVLTAGELTVLAARLGA